MKPIHTLAVALTATAILAGSVRSEAQVSPSGGGYLMRMKFVKGASASYTMATTMTMPGAKQPQTMTMPLSMRVVDVKNGIGTVAYKVGPMPGQQKATEATVKMDSRGNTVGEKNPIISGVSGMELPQKPVKVGETWKVNGTVPSMIGQMNTQSTYKFRGLKNVSGKQVALIDVTVSGSSGKIRFSGGGQMQLMASDGSLFAVNMTQKVATEQGSFDTKVQITRK